MRLGQPKDSLAGVIATLLAFASHKFPPAPLPADTRAVRVKDCNPRRLWSWLNGSTVRPRYMGRNPFRRLVGGTAGLCRIWRVGRQTNRLAAMRAFFMSATRERNAKIKPTRVYGRGGVSAPFSQANLLLQAREARRDQDDQGGRKDARAGV